MKKTKLIISLVVALIATIVFMPNIVKAESTVTLQKLEVTNTSGDYKTGDTITIVATYSDTILPYNDTAVQRLTIRFGANGTYQFVEGTVSGKTITFTYTIKDSDKGTLSISSFAENLKDADGNMIYTSEANRPELTGGKIVANPMEWTDTSDTEINIIRVDDTYWKAKLKLENIEPIDGHAYYFYITTTTDEPELTLDSSSNNITSSYSNRINFENEPYITEYFEYANAYFWLCDEQKNPDTNKYEQKFIMRAVKLDRPDQNKLGNRTQGFFFSSVHDSSGENSTDIYVYEPCTKAARKMNLKIGKVTDNSILLSIKNGEANCLQKLLDYAKSADSIYTGQVPVGSSTSITDNMDIVHQGYYYVYMQLEDENGKYYDVEDVSLYQANVGETVGKNLHDYLSNEFKWNLQDTNITPTNTVDTTTATVRIPQTGESMTIIAIVGVAIVVSAVIYVAYRKNKF